MRANLAGSGTFLLVDCRAWPGIIPRDEPLHRPLDLASPFGLARSRTGVPACSDYTFTTFTTVTLVGQRPWFPLLSELLS
jgi:hypothetical protein